MLVAIVVALYVGYRWGKSTVKPTETVREVVIPGDTVRLPGRIQYVSMPQIIRIEDQDAIARVSGQRDSALAVLASLRHRLSEIGDLVASFEHDTTITITAFDSRDSVMARQLVRDQISGTYSIGQDMFTIMRPTKEFFIRLGQLVDTSADSSPGLWQTLWDGYRTGSAILVTAAVVALIVKLFIPS